MADHDAAILPDLPPDASLTSLPALLSESANPGLVTAGAGRRRYGSNTSFRGPRGVCWSYRSSGRCVRGDACPFQHVHGLSVDAPMSKAHPPRVGDGSSYPHNGAPDHGSTSGMGSKTILCRSVSEGRVCQVNGCRFGHTVREVMDAVEFCRQRECVYYNRGNCRKGDSCPYVHNPARQQQQQRGQTESNQWRERQHHHVKRDDGISGSSLLETPPMGLQDNSRQYSKTSRGPWVGKGGGTSAHLGHVQQQQGPPAMVTMSAEGTGGEGWPTREDSDGRGSGGDSPAGFMSGDFPTGLTYVGLQVSSDPSSVCFDGTTQGYVDYCRALQLRETLYPNVSVERLRRASTDAVYED